MFSLLSVYPYAACSLINLDPADLQSTELFALDTPQSSTNILMDSGVNPRRRSAAMETRRGSSRHIPYEEAFALVLEELSMPYIPKLYHERFLSLHEQLKQAMQSTNTTQTYYDDEFLC